MSKDEDDFPKTCPKCGSEWKITEFNVKKWKDCVKCGKTAEAIMKDNDKKSQLPDLDDDWGLLLDQGFDSMGYWDED